MGILGKLLIELAANTARLQSDMGRAVSIAEKASAKIKTAFKFAGGGLIGAALVNTVKQSIEFGDQIQKAATKAGTTAKVMSELAYAAKLADVDIASLSTAIKKMQVSLSEAGTGAKAPTLALQALGITVEDLQKRRPEQQFELIAQKISELKDPADKARAATELFGKAGADLLPMFEQGAAGIRKAREEAQKLGLSFSDDDIAALSKADDSIKRLSASWEGFAAVLVAKVSGPLSGILDMLSGIDSRDLKTKLTEDIASLEKSLQRGTIGLGGGVGGMSAEQRQKALDELANMRGRLSLMDAPRLTETGGHRGKWAPALGYAAANAADEAKKEAEKAAEAERKAREKASKNLRTSFDRTNDQILDASNRRIDETVRNEIEAAKQISEYQQEMDERVAKARYDQQHKLTETAQFFKDTMLTAFDDWIRGGKFKFDEFIRYMIARWAQSQLSKLLDSALAPKNDDAGAGGVAAGVFGGLAKMLGFAKGGRPQPGIPYLVGEQGPEVRVDDRAGTIFPSGSMGGGIHLAPTYHLTVQTTGDPRDAERRMGRQIREANEQLLNDLRRAHLLVGT